VLRAERATGGHLTGPALSTIRAAGEHLADDSRRLVNARASGGASDGRVPAVARCTRSRDDFRIDREPDGHAVCGWSRSATPIHLERGDLVGTVEEVGRGAARVTYVTGEAVAARWRHALEARGSQPR